MTWTNDQIEMAAKFAYFGYVDANGYPNGLQTWEELSAVERLIWVSVAEQVLNYADSQLR